MSPSIASTISFCIAAFFNFSLNNSFTFTTNDRSYFQKMIVMDSDLQDPPHVALALLKKWEEGYDVVYAKRRTRKNTLFKKVTAHIFYRILNKLSDISIPKDTGDFRLLDQKVVKELKKFKERNRFVRGLISYIGFRQTGVLFDRSQRFAGKTSYTFSKMVKLAFDAMISFSSKLLTGIMVFGGSLTILGLVGLIVMGIESILGHISVSTMTAIIIGGAYFTGLQMIMFGFIGTYIGRLYTEALQRPLYIIESIYQNNNELYDTQHIFQTNNYSLS